MEHNPIVSGCISAFIIVLQKGMHHTKNIANTIFNKWADKEEPKKQDASEAQPSFLSNLMIKAYMSATQEFQRVFIYGEKLRIMHKGKPKEMFIYLDNKIENLLWISSKTKAFIVDLYFTTVVFKKLTTPLNDSWIEKYCFSLCQLEEQVIFVFETEAQNIRYFNLFSVYIDELKVKYPNYTLYSSNIKKLHAMNSTKHGTNSITFSEILDISEKLGLENKKQNEQILQMCLKYNNAENRKKDIPQKCFDDYFEVQFCNRKLQPIFEEFSKEKINSVKNDPRAILKKVMSPDEFADFLRKSQKEGEKQIAAILGKYKGELSFFNFCIYLYDFEMNNASRIEETPQNFPLKDYFCYSSHNTYLSGNQITSDSQVQRYAEDLENGIKCVEIDIHNDSNGKPIVNHAFKGMALCKPIEFEDVIKVIRVYSEKTELEEKNHYPIILSLENHANYENREFMLDSLSKHFAGKLYMIDGDSTFPTLSYLKGKILIKTNSTEEELRYFKKTSIGKKLSNSDSKDLYFGGDRKKFRSEKLQNRFSDFQKFKERMISQRASFNARIERKEQILALVSDMTKITSIFKSSDGVKAKNPSQFGCTSLTFSSVNSADPEKIISYTKTGWLRTYPHGTQINSNNYDPAPMFAVGAQIIALNTQTKDYYAWILRSYFCGGYTKNLSQRGYVLKPAKLRTPDMFDFKETKQKHKLKIEVIQSSGFQVVMKFFGLAEDNSKNTFSKNEFSYSNPDESFIMFDIGEKYRNCLAIRWIRQGYRILEGRDKNNYMDCGKRILLKITKSMSL